MRRFKAGVLLLLMLLPSAEAAGHAATPAGVPVLSAALDRLEAASRLETTARVTAPARAAPGNQRVGLSGGAPGEQQRAGVDDSALLAWETSVPVLATGRTGAAGHSPLIVAERTAAKWLPRLANPPPHFS